MAKRHVCILCGESVPNYKTIAHRNDRLAEGFSFCSDCVTGDTEPDKVIDTLRMLNIPYVHNVWVNAEGNNPDSPFSEYLKIIAPKRKYKKFTDSEFDDNSDESFEVTDELVGRWGTLEDKNDYIDLELAYQDFKRLKPPTTSSEDRQYIEAVRLGQRLRKEIDDGKASDIKSLREAYTASLKDIGLDSTSLYKSDSEEGIGVKIQKFENTEPLPDMAPEFKDVDRIITYIRVLFANSMKRVHGLATEDEISELQNLKESIIPRKGDRD